MDIFSVLSLVGGLALFLFGMDVMGSALERRAGGKLQALLGKLTSNKIAGLLTGLGVTAVIQSSSATTVMVVGFVNSGLMTLKQAINVIMGANIGTTVTAWILSLGGISGDNIIVQLLKPMSFTPILALIGIIFFMFLKDSKKKDTGAILLGFAVLMFGMDAMSNAVSGLAEVEGFKNLFLMFKNPILGVLAGAILTAIIQSSSASVGILQALATTGLVSYGAAIPIIMGQNIGTCITAILSSFGTNRNAKRAALVHLSFNVIGTIVWLTVFSIVKMAFAPALLDEPASLAGIAVAHSVFNIACTTILLPMSGLLEKLAYMLIPETKKPESVSELDERLLATPSIAIAQSKKLTHQMAEISRNSLFDSLELVASYDADKGNKVREDEKTVDHYEDTLGTYLVKLSRESLSMKDSHEVANLLHTIGDFERISDHAVNLLEVAEEVKEKGIVFSPEAVREMKVLSDAIHEILTNTVDAFINEDLELAQKIEPLEQVVDKIKFKLKQRHIKRLQNDECTIEMGFVFSDFITNCERVADHCSNIAVCLIQVAEDSFETHEYLQNVKSHSDAEFDEQYKMYKEKYSV